MTFSGFRQKVLRIREHTLKFSIAPNYTLYGFRQEVRVQEYVQTVDSFRQEETGQRYVDLHEDNDGSGRARRLMWTTQKWMS